MYHLASNFMRRVSAFCNPEFAEATSKWVVANKEYIKALKKYNMVLKAHNRALIDYNDALKHLIGISGKGTHVLSGGGDAQNDTTPCTSLRP